MEKFDSSKVGEVFKKLYSENLFIKDLYPWNLVEEMPSKEPSEMSGQIEIIGLSGSGKSEFIKHANNIFKDQEVVIRPELVTYNENNEPENWSHGKNSNKLKGLMLGEYGTAHQRMIWNQIKLLSHLESGIEADQKNKNLIIERGCNDVFASIQTTQPEHYSIRYNDKYRKLFNDVILQSIALASRVDATILFGTNWDTTTKRRINNGFEPEGNYVNFNDWGSLTSGYEIWLGSFYPFFKKKTGMGLLIIDGTADLDSNNHKVTEFCQKVFAMRKN